LFFCALLALLIVRLFILTGVQGEKWSLEADSNTVKTITQDAPRGAIFDRNGVLLAGNIPSFTVNFARNGMSGEAMNQSLSSLIAILEANKEVMLDEFPIIINSKGKFSYTYDKEITKWLKSRNMDSDLDAEEAYAQLRAQYDIDESVDKYEAQAKLIELGVNIPISLGSMQYKADRDKIAFLARFGVVNAEKLPNELPDAKSAFSQIREICGIDSKLEDVDARKILIVRDAVSAQGFMRYLPVTVAKNLKASTILQIEEHEHDLEGVAVVTESIRYYPEGNHASHIIGYMGRITESQREEYVEKGYSTTQLIGQSGIESSQEEILHGTMGINQILVNSSGEKLRSIGDTVKAQKGNDIMLTLDIRLQKLAEAALAQNLESIRTGKTFQSRFGDKPPSKISPNAYVGAVVAIDVKSGEPLAIVSLPDFNPNVFAQGITNEDWDALQSKNPRDALAPSPLYNVASRTPVQPGSTFKPMTGLVGLESGMSSSRTIYDAHSVEIGDHVYSCMGHHGNVNLFSALQASCNFYFFDVASGRDWARGGADLGFANNISIDKITSYAKQFGLGVKSGAEIAETIIDPPTAETKLINTKAMLRSYLYGQSESLFEESLLKNFDELKETIETIANWADDNPTLAETIKRMKTLSVKKSKIRALSETCKYTYYNYAQWSQGDEFNIAIGQGENAYTPLMMARYVATIGNGGTLNTASLIKAVQGVGEVERAAGVKADISNPQHLADVREGMRRVTKGGTLTSIFSGFPYNVGGKTGTAQRSGFVNPPDEVAYMKEHLGTISPTVKWADVQEEMKRLMKNYPRIYLSENTAVRRAIINLSPSGFSEARLDMYKSTYADFAWCIGMAPIEDPEIAVAVMVVQGAISSNVSPTLREVIGDYFALKDRDAQNGFTVDYEIFFDGDNRENTEEKVFGSVAIPAEESEEEPAGE
jgi:penicillin-binding protein 2